MGQPPAPGIELSKQYQTLYLQLYSHSTYIDKGVARSLLGLLLLLQIIGVIGVSASRIRIFVVSRNHWRESADYKFYRSPCQAEGVG